MLIRRLSRMRIPILWELIFIIVARIWPQHSLYTQLIFFLGLIFWFRKEFSLSRLSKNVRRGLPFWIPVGITVLLVFLAYELTDVLSQGVFLGKPDGVLNLWTTNSVSLVIFGISTVFIMPVAEELFFRRELLCFTDPGAFFGMLVISLLLYAVSHAIYPLGILEYIIIGIPLTLSFIFTRNVYVPIMAHMIFNAIKNIPDILYVVARMLTR